MTFVDEYKRNNDFVIVAGNGPSVKKINYKYFPYDYDVFRCNQFYLEDKYYLGKKVDLYFCNHSMKEVQEKTIKELINRNEYDIKYAITNFEPNVEFSKINEYSDENIISKFDNQLYKMIYKSHSVDGLRVTTGIHMLSVAYALGYKQIYLVGFDFYKEGNFSYCHDISVSPNLLSKIKSFNNSNYKSPHSEAADTCIIEYLVKSYPEVELLSIADDCKLSRYTNKYKWMNNEFVIEDKPFFYLNDIIL